MVMHGDILPAIPIVTPIYAVTAAKWRHLPALLRPISCRQNELYSVYSKKSRLSMKKIN